MDGRNVTLFPSEMVRENFAYYLYDGQDPDVPLRYATDYLLLPRTAPVVAVLRQDQRWRTLYEDAVCILLVRADERHAEVLKRLEAGTLQRPEVVTSGILE
jgi:hypothetical protein